MHGKYDNINLDQFQQQMLDPNLGYGIELGPKKNSFQANYNPLAPVTSSGRSIGGFLNNQGGETPNSRALRALVRQNSTPKNAKTGLNFSAQIDCPNEKLGQSFSVLFQSNLNNSQ